MTIDHDGPDFRISGGLWSAGDFTSCIRSPHALGVAPALFARRATWLPVFSTPFDETAVDLLESLGAPAYKIASFELVDLALISRVAKARKPTIISTGMGVPRKSPKPSKPIDRTAEATSFCFTASAAIPRRGSIEPASDFRTRQGLQLSGRPLRSYPGAEVAIASVALAPA